MVDKGRWVVLLYLVAKDLSGLRLIPLGVKEERERRPQWLGSYSFSNLNYETLLISAMFAMKYGRDLERLINVVIITKPELGQVHVLKEYFSDGFYHIDL